MGWDFSQPIFRIHITIDIVNLAFHQIFTLSEKTALYLARLYHPRYITLLKRFGAVY